MSKAEKFIQEHTKNCSNELDIPDFENGIKRLKEYHPWLTPDQAKRAVEIAREELLEKVCSFIDNNMDEYIDIRGYIGNTFIDVESDRFINDLKKAIKDE